MATPLYQQIASDISEQIRSGVLKPGDRLPSTRQLMERYRNAGQCSGLQAGGEGPRWEGRQARVVP
nr:GntR family transcriptional regulator [Micromonospora sp. DSM 115978]